MDDFTFGADVWGVNEPIKIEPSTSALEEPTTPLESYLTPRNQFDEFDDEFGEPAEATETEEGGDDFGDFGDFEEPQDTQGGSAQFGDTGFFETPSTSALPDTWEPIRLDPLPSRHQLERHTSDLLTSLWGLGSLSDVTTSEDIREAEGIAQLLIYPESRDLYNNLVKSLPTIKPPNWTRSRIRRQHLISLGVPVNLDEVMPHANGRPLPPLQISTRPMSAPPGPRQVHAELGSTTRPGTPQLGNRQGPSFGPKPELDEGKIMQLLSLKPDNLSLQPLPVLERYLAEIRSQTANTSAVLTHSLQAKDALQQNSETYNKLIAELVGEAQKIKTGAKVRTPIRRGSGMV
ncbi:hypothetical protein BDN71DRAFT_1452966 [Pleurotus eryngii]|uniref:Uncharacterized protein n=1 Tax=Pleurotus eryngii TaxID=5323 RepID=A0A9P6D3N8_PLEER|nr:hypothetical protein BDN71DRAFT_1452966 [Pleurotus eryngii]